VNRYSKPQGFPTVSSEIPICPYSKKDFTRWAPIHSVRRCCIGKASSTGPEFVELDNFSTGYHHNLDEVQQTVEPDEYLIFRQFRLCRTYYRSMTFRNPSRANSISSADTWWWVTARSRFGPRGRTRVPTSLSRAARSAADSSSRWMSI